MPIVKTTIKSRVGAWLLERQQTQRWLAEMVHVTPAYLAMILNRQRTPSLPVAKRLQDLTGIAATDFIHSRLALERSPHGPESAHALRDRQPR